MPEVCPFQGENIGPDWELGEEETPIFLFVGFQCRTSLERGKVMEQFMAQMPQPHTVLSEIQNY